MNGFAPLVAVLALAQAEPGTPAPPPGVPTESADAAERPAAPRAAAPQPPAPVAPDASAAPRPAGPPARPTGPRAAPESPEPAQPARAWPHQPALARAEPEPERTHVARVALAFLDALVLADADALTAACAERFSFDGDVRTGRDAVRRAWRELLARRDAPRAALLDLEILPAPDAVARLGQPPARVAPLAARGAWVGIADLSGRAVILFVARDGARWSVAGIHD